MTTIAAASQQIDRQTAIINEIRELHSRNTHGEFDICDECSYAEDGYYALWPCETMRIVEAVPL